MSHLDVGLLHALLDGEIPSRELPPIQEHLAGCAECRARFEEERSLLAESDGLVGVLEVPAGAPVTARPAPYGRPSWGRTLAWAASLIGAVGLGYAARGLQSPEVFSAESAQAIRSGADSAAAAGAAPSSAFNQSDAARERRIERTAPPQRQAPPAPAAGAREGTRSNLARDLAETQAKSVAEAAAPPAATPPPADSVTAQKTTPAPAAPQVGALRSSARLRDEPSRLDRLQESVASGAAFAQMTPAEPISFPDAVRRLGGSLRLIEGLVPLRLESQGPFVRVVYGVAQGELILLQQLVDGRVEYRFSSPAGFPADSLARLRARVRE